MNKDDKISELSKVQEMFKKAVENSDNKVQIAMQMYEMVSLHISVRQLLFCSVSLGWGHHRWMVIYTCVAE